LVKILSDVFGLPIYNMKHGSGAAGSAMLAASKTYFYSVIEAVKAMTQVEKEVHPTESIAGEYDELYSQFVRLLQEKGYISNDSKHA